MATNQDTTNIPPDAAEMATELPGAFATADSIAAQRLQNLQLFQQARATRLSRELATLKAEHAPDDEIKAAEAAVTASAFTASRVGIAHQQSTTSQPDVAPQGWALHGRVFDADLKPLSGFTVFLVDAQKIFQKAYGFAYTDDTGYFLINYPGSGAAAHEKPPRVAAPSETAAPSSAQASPAGPQLFLEIADTNAYPVYLSPTPFQPVPGTATYQNVSLAPGNQPIGDPPKEIRDIAVPPKRKTKPSPRKRG
jgi:hypothetical protein